MSNSTFTIAEMSQAFGALPDVIAEILYYGGHSPCDFSYDGCTASYDATAAVYVAERLPAQQAKAAVEQIRVTAAEQKQIYRVKMVPCEPSMRGVECE